MVFLRVCSGEFGSEDLVNAEAVGAGLAITQALFRIAYIIGIMRH